MHTPERVLSDFLLTSGLVSRSQLAQAEACAKEAEESLSAALIRIGALPEKEMRRAEAHALGVPYITLDAHSVSQKALVLIPEIISRAHNVVAYSANDSEVSVALTDIADLSVVSSLPSLRNKKLLPHLTDRDSLKRALLVYQKYLKETFGDTLRRFSQDIQTPRGEATAEELKEAATGVAVARTLDTLLEHALLSHASEVHIQPTGQGLRVRYRVQQTLYDAMTLPKQVCASLVLRTKLLAGLVLHSRAPQEGRFKLHRDGGEVTAVRVSTVPVLEGEHMVLRVFPEHTGRKGFTLETLGFHGAGLEHIYSMLNKTSGLLLVSGPKKSGTTTTLYTMLDMLNRPEVAILTIEDPIELRLPFVVQTQVREDIGFTYPAGVRALLRQHPNVLMIGDITDGDTAELALSAAERGILVLASVEAPNAAEGIATFLSFGVSPTRTARMLLGVVGQRLVRRLCHVRDTHILSRADAISLEKRANLGKVLSALKKEELTHEHTAWKEIPLFVPKTCPECVDGYSGAAGIEEVLPVTPAIAELIRSEVGADTLEEQARAEGMMTLLEDGIYKGAQGVTSVSEIVGLAE